MARRPREKSEEAYRTISEVAETLDVPQHVLRFWETKFKQLDPMKRAGGRRYYSPENVDLLKKIHFLLYTKGYTIKGAQKLLSSKKDMTSELLGISDHFSLKTEAQPKDIIQETTSSAQAPQTVSEDENNSVDGIKKEELIDALKDISQTLKQLKSLL